MKKVIDVDRGPAERALLEPVQAAVARARRADVARTGQRHAGLVALTGQSMLSRRRRHRCRRRPVDETQAALLVIKTAPISCLHRRACACASQSIGSTRYIANQDFMTAAARRL